MKLKTGDIFLTDSQAGYAIVVKFLMQAPTVWLWLWRKIFGGQNKVRYYHAGMIYDFATLIEQQKIVEKDSVQTLEGKKVIFWRKKHLTVGQATKLQMLSEEDLGKGYDVKLIFGKTLTWLTGIKWFQRKLQSPGKEICVTRVAYWYSQIGVTFGQKNYMDCTTDIIDDYCQAHPDEWEEVTE